MMTELQNAMFAAAAITLLLPSLSEAAESQIELQRNPFARPAVEELVSDAAPVNDGLIQGRDPGLRAVLFAGSRSVVDLGGVILQIGESTNGYELISVEEGKAIFNRRDEIIVLSLYEQDDGEER